MLLITSSEKTVAPSKRKLPDWLIER